MSPEMKLLAVAGAAWAIYYLAWRQRGGGAPVAGDPEPIKLPELPSCTGVTDKWEYRMKDGRCYYFAECLSPEEIVIHEVEMVWCAAP